MSSHFEFPFDLPNNKRKPMHSDGSSENLALDALS
jgi:hypothetical protein